MNAHTSYRKMKKLLMKPLKALASPGIYLFGKYNQYKNERQRPDLPIPPTENELTQLNTKIDKLLNKLNGKYAEAATNPEEECVICVNAKAVMQTYPCGHKVVCRRCFVKTIQIALTQRTLPLRCVICRAKILRLRQTQNSKIMSSAPSFRSRSSSYFRSKRSMVSSGLTGEGNSWPGVSKYSRSLPGINGSSFKCRSSFNRSYSTAYRKSSNYTRKCYRSCSLSSYSSMRGNFQKSSVSVCQQLNYEQRNNGKGSLATSPSEEMKETLEVRKKPSRFVSREKLIQQFQRDFHEGQISARSLTAKVRPGSCKNPFPAPKQYPSIKSSIKTDKTIETKYSTSEKRKTIESSILQENIKYREKSINKMKEKTNTKTSKLIKFEKKEKNKSENENGKCTKNSKKEKKVEKKIIKMK